MSTENMTNCSAKSLWQELAEFQITNSPGFADFSFESLITQSPACRIVRDNARRRVFYLHTADKGYYLKLSILARRKDRRRHFLLPFRKWAEWRNLHRLLAAGIPAARPVLKGEMKKKRPVRFFLLTEKIDGQPLKLDTTGDAAQMGAFASLLHSHDIYHADLHPDNVIVDPQGRPCLVDVQEAFFLSWIPRRLRIRNLGRIFFNLGLLDGPRKWSAAFLNAYNAGLPDRLELSDLIQAAQRHQQRKYRSRSRRCCKNSTEFTVIRKQGLRGFKRRDFNWDVPDLERALAGARSVKGNEVVCYQGVCIKTRPVSYRHRNRCLDSWKMSRALEVRGISVPPALAYLVYRSRNYFLSEMLDDGLHLNDYLSSMMPQKAKRRALKHLAHWVRAIHDANVWQRDFKSNNIICRRGRYYMLDLDGVRIRPLTEHHRMTNLAQLNASLSRTVTFRDRLRFFGYYAADDRLSRRRKRENYEKIWNITQTRDTVSYGLDLDLFDLCRTPVGNPAA